MVLQSRPSLQDFNHWCLRIRKIVLLNLIKDQWSDVDKIFIYPKDSLESKYQLLINRKEKVQNNQTNNLKEFIDYYAYEWCVWKFKRYSLTKNRKVTEFSLKEWKAKISLVFISQSYCKVPKTITTNATLFYHEII